MQEKQEVINNSEKVKFSRSDEHDDDENVIITSFQPCLLPSTRVS